MENQLERVEYLQFLLGLRTVIGFATAVSVLAAETRIAGASTAPTVWTDS